MQKRESTLCGFGLGFGLRSHIAAVRASSAGALYKLDYISHPILLCDLIRSKTQHTVHTVHTHHHQPYTLPTSIRVCSSFFILK